MTPKQWQIILCTWGSKGTTPVLDHRQKSSFLPCEKETSKFSSLSILFLSWKKTQPLSSTLRTVRNYIKSHNDPQKQGQRQKKVESTPILHSDHQRRQSGTNLKLKGHEKEKELNVILQRKTTKSKNYVSTFNEVIRKRPINEIIKNDADRDTGITQHGITPKPVTSLWDGCHTQYQQWCILV